jgi:PAS domain S-box-containing protein
MLLSGHITTVPPHYPTLLQENVFIPFQGKRIIYFQDYSSLQNILPDDCLMISVLYVDDEPAILDTCRRILERTGRFRVETVASAHEALERIRAGKFDAVIADYQMADITGLDLLRIIRNDFPDLPFIIFTGKGREEVVIEAFEKGVDFYLQKGGDAKSQYAELAHKIEIAVENRQVKKKLARSEERFRNFVENFEGIAFQIDSAGRFILLEGTVEETTGYPRQEFISGYVTLESIIHAEDKERFTGDLRNLSAVPGFHTDCLLRVLRKDGRIRWVHGIFHNICTAKQDIAHIQGSLYDITYLKDAQDELAKTEAKWRAIITRAPIIISVVDRKGTFLFINKTHPPKKPADLIGTSAGAYLAPGNENLLVHALDRVFGNGETMRFESAVPHGDTITEWLSHQISRVSWNGSHEAALVVSTVITERKWLEQNLRDSEEQYRAIVTASGDGIIILDPTGMITFGSPRVYDIFAIPCEQPLAGLSALDLIDPSFRAVASSRMKSILEGDLDAEPFEYLLVKHNEQRFLGELVTTPLRDSSGTISSLLVLIRDISKRKSPEQAP